MPNLIGIHDKEGIIVTPPETWILDTIALSENPVAHNYNEQRRWICRVNWGYGSTGTIPEPIQDNEFLYRLSKYVSGSKNCRRWIIGNEPNLPREWPNNQPIHPSRYAEFYLKCRDVIHKQAGHEKDEVLIAASGPWNNEYKYVGNPNGDWIQYFRDIFKVTGLECDGFSLHAYTHGYDRSLVTSEAMMNAPFQNHHYNFRTYRDYCVTIPDIFAHLPIYITEANGNGPWQAVGLMPAMAVEINNWNRESEGRKILSLIFYRYPAYDQGVKFHMQGKPDVLDEYKATVALNFKSPQPSEKLEIFMPQITNDPSKPQAVIKATVLNVRDRPGISGSIVVGQLKQGDKISILEEVSVGDTPWYRIGPDQWVIAEWTQRQGPSAPQDNWQRSRAFTAAWEGGFQDFDWDIGNWTGCAVGKGQKKGTNFGISACSYPGLDIKNLSREQADSIYFQDYWVRSGADKLDWPMCLLVFDTAINFHPTTAAKWWQESGGNTLKFCALRLRGYRKSRAWPQAGNAWVDRVIDLMLEAGG